MVRRVFCKHVDSVFGKTELEKTPREVRLKLLLHASCESTSTTREILACKRKRATGEEHRVVVLSSPLPENVHLRVLPPLPPGAQFTPT